jgi:hypothetical protein
MLMDLWDQPRASVLHQPHVVIPRLGITLAGGADTLGSFCRILGEQDIGPSRNALHTLKTIAGLSGPAVRR